MVRKLAGMAAVLALVAACGCVSTGKYNKDMNAQKALTREAMDKAAAVQKSADEAVAAKDKEIQALSKQLADAKGAGEKAAKEASALMEAAKAQVAAAQAAQKQAAERAAKAEAQAQALNERIKALEADSKSKIEELTKQLEAAKKPAAPAPARAPAK